MFLCHFPSGRPAWALPSALPGGARTFLSLPKAKSGHPAYWAKLSIASLASSLAFRLCVTPKRHPPTLFRRRFA